MIRQKTDIRLPGILTMLVVLSLIAPVSCGKKSESQTSEESAPVRISEASAPEHETEPQAAVEQEPASPAEKPEPVPESRQRSEPRAPDFSLRGLDGTTITLSDFRGKVVLLDFWATWCGPCRMGIPHLIDLHREYGPQGFAVLGISVDQQGPTVVEPFVRAMKIPYPVAMADMSTVQRYGPIQAVPTAFLVDREGYIVGQYEGYRDKSFFEREIKRVLSQHPVS